MKGHRIFLIVATMAMTLGFNTSWSQSSSFSGVGVLGGCSMSFFSTHHFDYGGMFSSPGVINGARTAGNLGLIYFNVGSSWTNADELQYIDGYVVNATTQAFTFPIGHNSMYKPLALTGVAGSTTAAYWNGDATAITGANTNTAIAAISAIDYWEAIGSNASTLTLSYDATSNISGLTGGNINNLSIVGWNGTSWDVIPSLIDANRLDIYTAGRNFLTGNASVLMSGSITTTGNVDLDNYQYFSLASLSLPFSQFIAANNGLDKEEVELFLFPNPAESFDNLTVVYHIREYESADIVIFDMKGQVLYTQPLSSSQGIEKINEFPHRKNGSYLISIITNTGQRETAKVVVVD